MDRKAWHRNAIVLSHFPLEFTIEETCAEETAAVFDHNVKMRCAQHDASMSVTDTTKITIKSPPKAIQ